MRRCFISLCLGLLTTACGSPQSRQLEAVKSARSILAEWSLAEREAAAGRATETYLSQFREQARTQLSSTLADLPRGEAAQLAMLAKGRPSAGALDRAASALAPLETSLVLP